MSLTFWIVIAGIACLAGRTFKNTNRIGVTKLLCLRPRLAPNRALTAFVVIALS